MPWEINMSIPRAFIIALSMTLLVISLSCSGDKGTNGGALTAPSNLIGEVVSSKAIRLAWFDNSDGESGFAIWRSQFGVFDHADTTGPNETFFTATDLEDSTTYTYYVASISGGAASGPSNTVEIATRHSASAPNAPTNPFPADSSVAQPTETRLSWSGSDPNNEPLTYEIYLGKTYPPPFMMHQDSNSLASLSPFDAGATYFWRVVAVDSAQNRRSGPIWMFATAGPGNQPPGAPASPSPANNAANVGIGATLSWQGFDPDGDPLTYDVYFGASDPPALVGNQEASTFDPPGDLSYNTVYYWRIVARDSTHGTSGPTWRFTTAIPGNEPPNAPSNPEPADGALGVATDVTLLWQGSDPNGDTLTYDVYFGTTSNPPLVSPSQQANSYVPGALQSGTQYFWKITARDRSGNLTSGPTWSFTTTAANQPPEMPLNPNPPNLQFSVPIDAQVSWQCTDPDGDSISFDVFFGLSNPPPFVGNQTATSYDPPGNLNNNAIYYWRITARDNRGGQTQGTVWRFTTAQFGNQPPSQPTNPGPSNGQVDVPLNASVSWEGSDPENDPLTYDVYFGTSNPPSLIGNQSATSYDPPGDLAGGTTYYWQIVAKDNNSHQTQGPIWSFTTISENGPPAAPSNPSPPDGQYGVARNVILSWSATDPDGDPLNFDVYFGTATSPPLAGNQTSMTFDPPGELADSVTYYWRIVAKDGQGHETSGPTWRFTSVGAGNAAPNSPSNPSPADGASAVPLDASISWQGSDPDGDPLTYDVYFGTANPPVFVRNQTGTSYNPPGDLAAGTTYYWQIVVHDNRSHQTPGPIWSFTTVTPNGAPAAPSNPSPSNGQANVPVSSAVSWQGSDPDGDPLTFDVFFGTVNPPPFVRNQTTLVYDPPGDLAEGTTFYWRIRARDDHDHLTFGPVWSFTTIETNQPPAVPSGPSPADGQSDVGLNTDLSWQASTDPDGDQVVYDVYFGTSSNPPLAASNRSGTSYDPPPLQNSTIYYWRIVAKDNFDNQSSGPVWSFVTVANLAPNPPNDPNPNDGETGVETDDELRWSASDPEDDPLTYDVYFGTTSPPPFVRNQETRRYNPPGDMQDGTTYYWQIIARDDHQNQTSGPVWSFSTENDINLPPAPPSGPGPATGSIDIPVDAVLTWQDSDPNGDTLTFDVYFGASFPAPFVGNQTTMSYDPPGEMQNGTTYFWGITARDGIFIVPGPIWSFTTVAANAPPLAATNPSPLDGAADVDIAVTLGWQGSDPDGDPLTYDVSFGTENPPPLVGNQGAASYDPPGDLLEGTTYFWSINTRDDHAHENRRAAVVVHHSRRQPAAGSPGRPDADRWRNWRPGYGLAHLDRHRPGRRSLNV